MEEEIKIKMDDGIARCTLASGGFFSFFFFFINCCLVGGTALSREPRMR